MMRKCPYCQSRVSFWSVIKPGLYKDTRITCQSCGKPISEFWTYIPLPVWLGLGLLSVIVVNLLNSTWYWEILFLFLYFVVLLVLAYFMIPLKQIDEE